MSLSETLSFWKLFFVLFHICYSDKFFCWRFTPFLNFAVHGALRCLALLSVDLDDTVVPTLIPALFPCLLTIVSSPQVSILCLLFQLIVFELFSIWRQVKLLCRTPVTWPIWVPCSSAYELWSFCFLRKHFSWHLRDLIVNAVYAYLSVMSCQFEDFCFLQLTMWSIVGFVCAGVWQIFTHKILFNCLFMYHRVGGDEWCI